MQRTAKGGIACYAIDEVKGSSYNHTAKLVTEVTSFNFSIYMLFNLMAKTEKYRAT